MAQLQTARVDAPQYILGHAAEELDRLIAQAAFYGDLTEHHLRLAGLAPGMRVLDVGCGAGDVSFLAARLVGASGTVIGVDKAPEAVDLARERARMAGLTNVEFLVADVADVRLDQPVDALIGRFVLMYFAEPAAVLRRLLRHLRPGGVVAFQELHAEATTSEPRCPAYEAAVERIRQTVRRAGSDPQAGLKLWHIFREAGLPAPRLLQQARVDGGPASPIYGQLTQLTRTLLPLMERTGVASAAEVDIETLAERLRDEAVQRNAVMVFPPLIGAWTRMEPGGTEPGGECPSRIPFRV
jgi:ubiquinone/menaquinone biosynthesis C-methylase UbiE